MGIYNSIDKQLSKRSNDKIKSLLKDKSDNVFFLSPNDVGVYRNGGRRGSCFGPRAIMNSFMNMALPQKFTIDSVSEIEVCPNSEIDFDKSQQEEAKLIEKYYSNNLQNIIHIGGGHDHIYPLLKAASKVHKNITIINIDAHLDTRVDSLSHSGTPFRQFGNECEGKFNLIQLGIHPYANAKSNYKEIPNTNMIVHTMNSIRDIGIDNVLREIKIEDSFIILSLDADAISSSIMKGVSAVNHNGFEHNEISKIFSFYKKLAQKQKLVGIYEYNPLFDDLSASGSKYLAQEIYQILF
jgi:formiminoglutamase